MSFSLDGDIHDFFLPNGLKVIAGGIGAIGDAMQSFKGLDSDNMDFCNSLAVQRI